MLIAVDAAVLVEPYAFEKWIAFPVFVGNLPAIFLVNLLLGMISWVRLIISERELERRRRGLLRHVPIVALFFAFWLPVFMMVLNLAPFLYR
jgi:hypothetical protein